MFTTLGIRPCVHCQYLSAVGRVDEAEAVLARVARWNGRPAPTLRRPSETDEEAEGIAAADVPGGGSSGGSGGGLKAMGKARVAARKVR